MNIELWLIGVLFVSLIVMEVKLYRLGRRLDAEIKERESLSHYHDKHVLDQDVHFWGRLDRSKLFNRVKALEDLKRPWWIKLFRLLPKE